MNKLNECFKNAPEADRKHSAGSSLTRGGLHVAYMVAKSNPRPVAPLSSSCDTGYWSARASLKNISKEFPMAPADALTTSDLLSADATSSNMVAASFNSGLYFSLSIVSICSFIACAGTPFIDSAKESLSITSIAIFSPVCIYAWKSSDAFFNASASSIFPCEAFEISCLISRFNRSATATFTL